MFLFFFLIVCGFKVVCDMICLCIERIYSEIYVLFVSLYYNEKEMNIFFLIVK